MVLSQVNDDSSFVYCCKGLCKAEGNGKTVACSLEGQQNTLNSEHTKQLSCPKENRAHASS